MGTVDLPRAPRERALASWIRDEQQILWRELDTAIERAADGRWSMRAADVACRIVEAARLVGPTPHDDVLWTLTAGGVYEALLDIGGIEHEPLTPEYLRATERIMRDRVGTVDELRALQKSTITAMREPREARYIRSGRQ